MFNIFVLSVLASVTSALNLTFPPGFKFGAATSSYQVEGSWNVSDKSESTWDHFTHVHPEIIPDHSNADVATDSYRRWRDDVAMAVEMGIQYYRLSISWSRLLPSSFSNYVSQDGVKYYNDLINELLANNIEPVVTICHWDIPQRLQNLGGWTNPLISDWFAEYADVVFSLFADRVKTWITINEPIIFCDMQLNSGILAPGVIDQEVGTYICSKNALIAHAKAWRIYDKKYRPIYNGRITMTNQNIWYEGDTPDEEELAELGLEYAIGRYSHPVYSKQGGWPPTLEKYIRTKSHQEGYSISRLPAFTAEEIDLVKGTFDFYALNYYTSRHAHRPARIDKFDIFPTGDIPELNIKLSTRPNWTYGYAKVFPIYPPGLRKIMKWITNKYGPMEFVVTETGYTSQGRNLNDDGRIKFIHDHLKEVLLAVNEDKINVTGFIYWSLMDNFEWMDGYNMKFGLYAVDFEDPKLKRIPRKSSHYFRSVIEAHSLDVPLDPITWVEPQKQQEHPSIGTCHKTSILVLIISFLIIFL